MASTHASVRDAPWRAIACRLTVISVKCIPPNCKQCHLPSSSHWWSPWGPGGLRSSPQPSHCFMSVPYRGVEHCHGAVHESSGPFGDRGLVGPTDTWHSVLILGVLWVPGARLGVKPDLTRLSPPPSAVKNEKLHCMAPLRALRLAVGDSDTPDAPENPEQCLWVSFDVTRSRGSASKTSGARMWRIVLWHCG